MLLLLRSNSVSSESNTTSTPAAVNNSCSHCCIFCCNLGSVSPTLLQEAGLRKGGEPRGICGVHPPGCTCHATFHGLLCLYTNRSDSPQHDGKGIWCAQVPQNSTQLSAAIRRSQYCALYIRPTLKTRCFQRPYGFDSFVPSCAFAPRALGQGCSLGACL